MTTKKLYDEAFTLVETLIVLAIAAILLIIVLFAIPALQRASRNTTVKNDADTIAGAVSEFEGSHNNEVPTATSPVTYVNPTPYNGQYYMCWSNINTAPVANGGTGISNPCTANGQTISGDPGNNGEYSTASITFTISSTDMVCWTDQAQTISYVGNAGNCYPNGVLVSTAGYIIVDFEAACPTTSTTMITMTTIDSQTQAAILYPVESGSNSGSIGCILA